MTKHTHEIVIGTEASIEDRIVYDGTDEGAVRRWARAVRLNPDMIVELYRLDDQMLCAARPMRVAQPRV